MSAAFFYDVIVVQKKFQSRRKEPSRGGAITFLVLFHQYHIHCLNDIRRKLYMVGTYSTVQKRAKRMPDTTVETTIN